MIKWVGTDKTIAKSFEKTLRNVISKRVQRAIVKWVGEINSSIVLNITPQDTGDLRESLYVRQQGSLPRNFTVEVGFTVPYAPIVHEMPSDTNWTTPGTRNKYLQLPYYSNAYGLPGYIKSEVNL